MARSRSKSPNWSGGQRLIRVCKLKGNACEEEIFLVMFVAMLGQDKKKD